MSNPKMPIGSAPSAPHDSRPRAQVSYEGEDEFSAMSLDPKRKEAMKGKEKLDPGAPGTRTKTSVDDLKPTNDKGVVGFLRKIFDK